MEIRENNAIGENIENLFLCERSKRYERGARSEYLPAGGLGRRKPSPLLQGRIPEKFEGFQHIYSLFGVIWAYIWMKIQSLSHTKFAKCRNDQSFNRYTTAYKHFPSFFSSNQEVISPFFSFSCRFLPITGRYFHHWKWCHKLRRKSQQDGMKQHLVSWRWHSTHYIHERTFHYTNLDDNDRLSARSQAFRSHSK